MIRSVPLGLLCLFLFLLLFPLTVGKPGVPPTLKADEAAYYLMARSLAEDGDLRFEVRDGDRLFEEFPYIPTRNLILMTDDGWETVYFGKPYIYSLFAAPFAGLFGANGTIFFNMLLMVAMIWMGAVYLGRFNEAGRAALISVLFFLFSVGFIYVFWIHTEVFNMAAVTACLFFLQHPFPTASGKGERWGPLALSGAALALAVYNKPMILALVLPVVWRLGVPLLRGTGRRSMAWRKAAAWGMGFAICLGVVAGLATALTGHPSSYLGVRRQGVTLCDPGQMPLTADGVRAGLGEEPAPGPTAQGDDTGETRTPVPANAWGWLLKMPNTSPGAFLENLGYFFWGRHAGMLPYMPFALLAVGLFLVRRWRRRGRREGDEGDEGANGERWMILLGLTVYALFFLLFISWNWQGGGGFVGNRYFVNVYPACLFLLTRVELRWPLALGSAVAGLFLAPVLLAPYGLTAPEPTLQVHTRNAPFRYLPLELSLRNLPGYHRRPVGDLRFVVRKDQAVPLGERILLRGADRVEMWWLAARNPEPTGERALAFRLTSRIADHRVKVSLGGETRRLHFREAGEGRTVVFTGQRPDRRTYQRFGGRFEVYTLRVHAGRGALETWTRLYPPQQCPAFAYNENEEETFLTGVELLYLGSRDPAQADPFQVGWGSVAAPSQVSVAEIFTVPVRLSNQSLEPWTRDGAARVKLSYHWRSDDGERVVEGGRRTELPRVIPPGGRALVEVTIEAPSRAGRYTLELDPVLEHVAWFSDRGGRIYRVPIEVVEESEGAAE